MSGMKHVIVRIKGVEHHFWLDEAKQAIADLQAAVAAAEGNQPPKRGK